MKYTIFIFDFFRTSLLFSTKVDTIHLWLIGIFFNISICVFLLTCFYIKCYIRNVVNLIVFLSNKKSWLYTFRALHRAGNMSSTKYVQFCACLTSSLLIISMEFYMKDQTKTYQTTPMPLPLVIPSPVKEPNKTLCPKGRPKPIIDDVLCMVYNFV